MILTINDVAKRWQVDRRTVKKEMDKQKLKFFKVGREYRTRIDWLEEYEGGPNERIKSN